MHIRFGFSFSSIYLEIDNFFIPLNSLVYELLIAHLYWMSLVDLKTITLQLKFGPLILDTHLRKFLLPWFLNFILKLNLKEV